MAEPFHFDVRACDLGDAASVTRVWRKNIPRFELRLFLHLHLAASAAFRTQGILMHWLEQGLLSFEFMQSIAKIRDELMEMKKTIMGMYSDREQDMHPNREAQKQALEVLVYEVKMNKEYFQKIQALIDEITRKDFPELVRK